MAEATSDAFLSGQGIPVEPGQIEAELTRLWGPAAERAGGPELESPIISASPRLTFLSGGLSVVTLNIRSL